MVSGVLAVGLVASVGLLAGPAAAASNLLSDPGFESALSGWGCDAGTAAVVSSPVHSGSGALAGSPSSSDDAQCTQTVSVLPDTSYTLSGYVEGSYVYLGVTGGSSTWTPSASSWQQLSVTFTTGASQTSVQVFVHGWYAQPTYYADDLALTGPAGASSSPSASASVSATPSPSASASASHSASPSASASASASPTGTTGSPPGGLNWKVAPYIDITASSPTLLQVEQATGQKTFTLAFLLGSSAGCVPEFGASRYVGPARGGSPLDVAAHVENRGDCPRLSDDARLFLHLDDAGVVLRAELTDHVRGASGGPVLFRLR